MKGEDRAGTGPAPLFIVPSHHSSLQAVLSQLRSIFDLIAQFKMIQVFVVLWRKREVWHDTDVCVIFDCIIFNFLYLPTDMKESDDADYYRQ